MKKLALKLIYFIPFALLIGAVSYVADPGNLFRSDKVLVELASHISSGHNVWGFNSNVNERILLKYILNEFQRPRDIIVFGSSRSKAINEKLFPTSTFYNSAVSAGSLEDFVGIYQILYEKRLLPKELIIEVSVWMLDQNNPLQHNDVRSLVSEYARGRERIGLPPIDGIQTRKSEREADRSTFLRIKELFSPAYFQQSLLWGLRSLRLGSGLNSANIHITDKPIAGEFTVHSDGSWTSSEENTPYTIAEAIRGASIPKGPGNFRKITSTRKNEFEAFVKQVQADGVKVTFYFPPWPPETYERIAVNPAFRVVHEVDEYLQKVAQELNIGVVGDYDGGSLGLRASDFMDHEHPRRRVIAQVLQGMPNMSHSQ